MSGNIMGLACVRMVMGLACVRVVMGLACVRMVMVCECLNSRLLQLRESWICEDGEGVKMVTV